MERSAGKQLRGLWRLRRSGVHRQVRISGSAELPDGPPRLQKVLARAGIASRRHAEALIRDGRVRVNGQVVDELGVRVEPGRDDIEVDERPLRRASPNVYLALHKPPGFLSTTHDPQGRRTVMSLVPPVPGLFLAGRLDASSEGLFLLTTDGEWAQRVSHPRFGCSKEYVVEVTGRPDSVTLEWLRRPMRLEPEEWLDEAAAEQPARRQVTDREAEHTTGAEVEMTHVLPEGARLRIVLHEGRKRQIRRMLRQVGHPVCRLVRVRIGAISLGSLEPGMWRHLTPVEVASPIATDAIPRAAARRESMFGPAASSGVAAPDRPRFRVRRRHSTRKRAR